MIAAASIKRLLSHFGEPVDRPVCDEVRDAGVIGATELTFTQGSEWGS